MKTPKAWIKKHGRFIKSVVTLTVTLGFFFGGVLILWAATLSIPDLSSFEERKVRESTKIYDRTGEILLYDVHQDIRRTVVPLSEISENIQKATVAVEDAKFYEHNGIRPKSILRAAFKNLTDAGFSQGGSTITQQVVKNSVLTPDKKISRKIKELILSLKLEQELSKEEILELYLNETPYGGNVYGVEEAAKTFFAKDAKDLSVAESAYMAALPQAPTYFSPYGNHPEELEQRKNLVLRQMLENDFINEAEYRDALEEEVEFHPRAKFGILAPHFVFFIRERLVEKYGLETVEEGGLTVITSLDWELQKKAEEIVRKHALSNDVDFNASNAGLVAIDPKTGQIVAMVGSRDYFDEEIPGAFNITTAHRQPGSAFKPIVYATALEKGYTPETVVFDLKTQFSTACGAANHSNQAPCYSPSNYDNNFRGPVTFREALAQSLNIPAVKVLYLAGIDAALDTAKDLGIKSLTNKERYGLTLVLGGGEVSLLDLTESYSVFANEGKKTDIASVLRVENPSGEILEEYSQFESTPKQAIPKQVALQISDMLSDNAARTPAFGPNSDLYFPGVDVASKTGTTNDFRDAWIVGYTPEIAVGAWAGNNDNSPMEKRVAGFVVAPMWNEFMQEALKKVDQTNFEEPVRENVEKPILRGVWRGGQTFFIDSLTNKLATELTPEELRKESVLTSVHSILYWVDKENPRGPAPGNRSSDPQFRLWETPVRAWARANGFEDEDPDIIPEEEDDIHTPENAPEIRVRVSERSGDEIKLSVDVLDSKFDVERVEYFLDNILIGVSSDSPDFELSFNTTSIKDDIEGRSEIRAVAYDEVLNMGFDTERIRID